MKRKIQWRTRIFLCIYLLVLAYVCFLSEAYGRTELQNIYHYNLIPFYEIIRFFTYRKNVGMKAFVLNMFGNIAAFMPFGFMIPILKQNCREHVRRTAALTFGLSLIIECIQLISRVGSFDVDDLILNTFGGVLGFVCFWLMNQIRRCWFGKIQ